MACATFPSWDGELLKVDVLQSVFLHLLLEVCCGRLLIRAARVAMADLVAEIREVAVRLIGQEDRCEDVPVNLPKRVIIHSMLPFSCETVSEGRTDHRPELRKVALPNRRQPIELRIDPRRDVAE